ncbi:hypothetical protein BIW11_04850 [Tropilaelaps mercedesae]|uniref:Uncharacterized protein n=1 Tax=Tropilaelaps mercedesae TaxID=418985 RepID=A0A1V9X0I5_9ACAR|nr:hypothetical protein BIW11_04850 [Tropilaelaps mercedesae]
MSGGHGNEGGPLRRVKFGGRKPPSGIDLPNPNH